MWKKNSLEIKRAKELDAINSMKTKMKKSKKKSKIKDYDSKLSDFRDNFRIWLQLSLPHKISCCKS